MYKVYKILSTKNRQGKWYEEYEVPIGLPVPPDCITTIIPEGLTNPKYDFATAKWIEDPEALIDSLKKENAELKQKIELNEMALVDAISMLSNMITGES